MKSCKYIFILPFYINNDLTMKGALKAKSIFMRESCDFDCIYYSEEYLK